MRHRRSDPLAEEMSALDELEDELRRPKRRQGPPIVPLLITAIVMTGAMTIAWYSYNAGVKEGSEGAAPLLKPSGPMKVAPASPGGLDIPHREKTVYNAIDGRGRDDTAERLLPPPERPMSIPPTRAARPPRAAQAKSPAPPVESQVRSADRMPGVRGAPGAPVRLRPRALNAPSASPATSKPPTPRKTPASDNLKPPPEPPTLKKPPRLQPRAIAKATPGPAKNAAAATAYRIQIGSVSSQTQARKYWTAQAAKHRDILGKLSMNLQQATIKGRVFYRIQGGPLPNRAAASRLCDRLKRRQIGCILVPPKR